MKTLRTLTLTNCGNASFIFALDPSKNLSRTLLCPALEEFILYIRRGEQFFLKELLAMTKERASEGAMLSTIRTISTEAFASTMEVLKLRDHVTRVEYGIDYVFPVWDDDPDGIPDFELDGEW